MRLSERLQMLIGHELIMSISSETNEMDAPYVILDEVGEDYIEVTILHSQYAHPTRNYKIVNLSYIIDITHRPGCETCNTEKKNNP
jgi:hypothetical protein